MPEETDVIAKGNALHLIAVIVASTALAGCFENGAPRAEQAHTEPPLREKAVTLKNAPGIELATTMIDPAIDAHIAHTGADRAAIRVVRAVPVKWNNGALGCPRAGVSYTMAITPGYWVVLEDRGKLFSYHSGSRMRYALCEGAHVDPHGPPPHGRLNEDV